MLKKNLPWASKESTDSYKEEKKQKLSPFDFLKSIQGTIGPVDFSSEEIMSAYQPFMMNRIVSMNPSYIVLANEINMFSDVPKDQHFKYYASFIPKKSSYFAYIKKAADNEDAVKSNVGKYYECGTRDIGVAMKILTNEQKDKISDKYELDGKI